MSALLTDLYQLTMMQAYLDEGMTGEASFELFVRKLPAQRNFLVAAGLEQALHFLEGLKFSPQEIAWLQRQGSFPPRFLESLHDFRFRGDVHAMPEGSVFFADEPILRVTAPLPQAQFVESRLLNLIHFQTLIASKAARVVIAARGRQLIDFGMRRAHGAEAAILAARAAYIAGFDGTATAEAGRLFDIPVFGTMAHAFVQAHRSEVEAFAAFARARPRSPTLLIDTWDTEAAATRVAQLAPALAQAGITIGAVRLDSGDLAAHAIAVRAILDQANLRSVRIVASGNLDEHRIAGLLAQGAPIDAFGVGTALDTSSDAPALDAVYKLQRYAGLDRRKRSEGKATWPGVKQVWRSVDEGGELAGDQVRLEDEEAKAQAPAGTGALPGSGAALVSRRYALLEPVMIRGERVGPPSGLEQSRRHCARQLQSLPDRLRELEMAASPYPVLISEKLRERAQEVDRQQLG